MNSEPHLISSFEIKRAWRIVSWAGLLGSIYYLICINGAPRIKYLTELKATAFDFGLIAGFGSFALIFQVFGSVVSNRITRRKPLWMVLAVAHRLVFALALLAPILFASDRMRIWWIILVFALHDSLTHMGIPLWLSWMADLVPRHTMSRYWATRQKFITFMTMIAMVLLAAGFDYFEHSGKVIAGFTIIAAVGIVLGVIDIFMFAAVPEPPHERATHDSWTRSVAEPIRDKQFRPFLTFMGYWNFAIFLSAPFFGLFMIEGLKLNVLTVQIITVAHSLGVVVSSRFWGLVCDTYGFRRVLQILTVAKISAPLYFLLAPPAPSIAIPFLIVMHIFDGVLNSGVTLATQGVLLKSTPRRNRAMYIATTNFLALGVMAGIAPILAGKAIDHLNHSFSYQVGIYTFTGYHAMFLLSTLLRIGAIPLAARIHEKRDVALGTVLRQIFARDTYRVARLVHQLHESPDERRRLQAVHLLRDMGHPMAIAELINALEDPSREVREATADALGWFGVGEAAEPLAKALHDPDPAIQARAARALGRIGGEESLLALLQNLKNENTHALHETVDALGQISDSAAMVPLIYLFYEFDNPHLRRRIAIALSKMSDSESVEEVMSMLASEAVVGGEAEAEVEVEVKEES